MSYQSRLVTFPPGSIEAWLRLTKTEREMVWHVQLGHAPPEIARLTFRSPETIRTHFANIYRKLDVHSQVELRALAERLHWDEITPRNP